jgi:hypothetical protein
MEYLEILLLFIDLSVTLLRNDFEDIFILRYDVVLSALPIDIIDHKVSVTLQWRNQQTLLDLLVGQ